MVNKKYQLNQKQQRILILLYKFRFITVPLLQEYLGLKQPSTVWRTLKNLEEQGYVGSHYDQSYIKLEKPAYYYLEKKGIALLKEDDTLSQAVLHTYYRNKNLSEEAREHALTVMAAHNFLVAQYPDQFHIFTRQEIGEYDEFPDTCPDLYLRSVDGVREYFITLAHDAQPFLTRKRLAEYVEHSEEAGWPSGQYPTLLYVCKSSNHEAQLLEYAAKVLESAGIDDDIRVATTTLRAITTKPYQAAIWSTTTNATPASLDRS